MKSAQLLYKKVLIDVFSASPFSDGASVRIVLKMAGKYAHIKLLNQTYLIWDTYLVHLVVVLKFTHTVLKKGLLDNIKKVFTC